MNVARSVIRNFVERAPAIDKEEVNWRDDLPGRVRLRAAPQYWIWKHEHIESESTADRVADIKARHHGLVQLVLEVAPGAQLVDLRKVLVLNEDLITRCSKEERAPISATYTLFNVLIADDDRAPKWQDLLPRFEEELATRTIESMSFEVILDEDLRGELTECIAAYKAYAATRFWQDGAPASATGGGEGSGTRAHSFRFCPRAGLTDIIAACLDDCAQQVRDASLQFAPGGRP